MSTRMLSLRRAGRRKQRRCSPGDGVSGAERSRFLGLAPHSPCSHSPGTDSWLCISHLGGRRGGWRRGGEAARRVRSEKAAEGALPQGSSRVCLQ